MKSSELGDFNSWSMVNEDEEEVMLAAVWPLSELALLLDPSLMSRASWGLMSEVSASLKAGPFHGWGLNRIEVDLIIRHCLIKSALVASRLAHSNLGAGWSAHARARARLVPTTN